MRLFAVLLICLAAGPWAALAETRVALVIGNAAYSSVADLANPLNDAADISRALTAADFSVTRVEDAGFDAMRRALSEFGDAAARADVAVIYFAGHGMEVDRQNYLLPVDAELDDARDVAFHAVPLGLVRRAARPARRLSLVIVDACRNNPFLDALPSTGRSLTRGLVRVQEQGQNTLVAFAAKEGTIAEDGGGRNSPYAEALTAALAEPGLEIGKLFRRVRDDVLRRTGGRQEPALYGSLSEEDFFFRPPEAQPVASAATNRGLSLVAAGTAGGTATGGASAPAANAPGGAVDLAFWNAIAASSDPRDFEDYLAQFPNGAFAGLAERRLEALSGNATPNPTPEPTPEPARPEPEPEPEIAAITPATETPEPARAVTPEYRPSRSELRDVQARLTILGLDPGPTDGLMGRRTRTAIATYQRRIGEEADGRLTQPLIARLTRDVPPAELAAWQAEREAARLAAARRAEERAKAAEEAARAARPAEPTPVASPEPEPAAPAPTEQAKIDKDAEREKLRRRCEWLDSTGNAARMRECEPFIHKGVDLGNPLNLFGGGETETGNPAERTRPTLQAGPGEHD